MNLDFTYQNPTTIYFGKTALDNLSSEIKSYGDTILLAYGKGAIKKNGLYDQVIAILKANGKKLLNYLGLWQIQRMKKLKKGLILCVSIM